MNMNKVCKYKYKNINILIYLNSLDFFPWNSQPNN